MWFLQKNHQKEWVMTLMIRNDCRSWSDHGFSGVWVIFRPRKCTHSALSNKCYLTPNKASFAIKWSFLPQIPYRKYSLNHGSITQWASFIHMRIFMYIVHMYHRIGKTTRTLLYLKLENNSRKLRLKTSTTRTWKYL